MHVCSRVYVCICSVHVYVYIHACKGVYTHMYWSMFINVCDMVCTCMYVTVCACTVGEWVVYICVHKGCACMYTKGVYIHV